MERQAARLRSTDYVAAERALARNWPDIGTSTAKYSAMREKLAEFHLEIGAESFELRYNLKLPKNRVEEWTLEHMHGKITDAKFAAKLKRDAERPIDIEMLSSVFDGYHGLLKHYGSILQEAVPQPRMHFDERAKARNEQNIDTHIAVLEGKLPIWREHLETVFEYLEECRIGAGLGLLALGDFEATSAHWLAQLAFTRTIQVWKSCKEVAHRSHTDPRYLYAVGACDMFFKQWFPKLPKSQALGERMREEFVLARMALAGDNSATPRQESIGLPLAHGRPVLEGLDNESKEVVLVGEFQALVAASGHISRVLPHSDWGIDAEIEFKNDSGHASGKRVYVQLKSGDSHLTYRKRDNALVFRLAKARHAEYWQQQAYPVMLVVRSSVGQIQWMNVSQYLIDQRKQDAKPVCEIIFNGQDFSVESIQGVAAAMLDTARR